jgi:cytochrome c oxidase polypeptide 4
MLGFFSPGSIWPFVMCVGIGIMGYAIAFMAYWLLLLGAVILIWSGIMLNLQYIMPKEKH